MAKNWRYACVCVSLDRSRYICNRRKQRARRAWSLAPRRNNPPLMRAPHPSAMRSAGLAPLCTALRHADLTCPVPLQSMFFGASSFNADLSGWNVVRVTTMSNMFEGASSLAYCTRFLIHASFSAQVGSIFPSSYSSWASYPCFAPSPPPAPPPPLPRRASQLSS